ncbi:MAG: hypothetical protein GY719_39055 [bacterium]|nr:hypothetical protein [bacterium]
MSENRPLELSVARQEEEPHFVKCFLTVDRTWRLYPLTVPESEAISELMARAGGKSGVAVLWTTDEDPRFDAFLGQAQSFAVSDESERPAPMRTFAVHSATGSGLAETVRTVWNSYDQFRAYSSDSGDSDHIARLVEQDADTSDEARIGLDWNDRWYFQKQRGCLVALIGGFLGTVRFALRLLLSPGFRRELMDPFGKPHLMSLVAEHGAVFWKVEHDDAVGFEFLTTSADIASEAEAIFEAHRVPLDVEDK